MMPKLASRVGAYSTSIGIVRQQTSGSSLKQFCSKSETAQNWMTDEKCISIINRTRRFSNSSKTYYRKNHPFNWTLGRRKLSIEASPPASSPQLETNVEQKRVLITGASGQIGTELAPLLASRYGAENVITSDVKPPVEDTKLDTPNSEKPQFIELNVMKKDDVLKVVKEEGINLIIHNAATLSAVGEQNPLQALMLNTRGIENMLQIAHTTGCQIFVPSTIAVFGTSTPPLLTPNNTILQPSTVYGISKVYTELLGKYFHDKFGVDFRSLRYPGIISSKALPGGGTTDYAIDMFHHAISGKEYTCFVSEHTALPMMHITDCLKATLQLLEADEMQLRNTSRVYNIGAVSFSPKELERCIQRHYPTFRVRYAPDYRDEIANSWPRSVDDSVAVNDFKWQPQIGFQQMVDSMLSELEAAYDSNTSREELASL